MWLYCRMQLGIHAPRLFRNLCASVQISRQVIWYNGDTQKSFWELTALYPSPFRRTTIVKGHNKERSWYVFWESSCEITSVMLLHGTSSFPFPHTLSLLSYKEYIKKLVYFISFIVKCEDIMGNHAHLLVYCYFS